MLRGAALSSTHRCCQNQSPPTPGQLATSYSTLDVAPSSVTVESVKKAEDSNEYIVRLYETEDKAADRRPQLYPRSTQGA